MSEQPVDYEQRRQALDVDRSFIVQAPAGSGKTELLIQRILALLAVSSTPEEVLAITFTRKAAAEMHKRLLEALERASSDVSPPESHAAWTWTLARTALARDRELCWNLLESPTRLQVLTIDSFCATLVRRMPWLARFGEIPAIVEDPADLYRVAAERLLARLEQGRAGAGAVERLLTHLDNRVPLLRDLVVVMLGRRDQWLRHLDTANLASARPDLEAVLCQQIVMALLKLKARLDDDLLDELCILGEWAAGNLAAEEGENPLQALFEYVLPPSASVDALPAWLALARLVLTEAGDVRKTFTKAIGFPADKNPAAREMKKRIQVACDRLRTEPVIIQCFRELRCLPAPSYGDSQWEVLVALIELLPLADYELRETFKAKGQVDFIEVTRGALAALGDDLAPSDLLLHLDSRLRHILVDEFQDTSRGQYELLSRLTTGWERDDGRTLFVVGDPMQSIYRFREAEVGLYLRARSSGLENVQLASLTLQANFRSQAGLVAWFNTTFAPLFPHDEDEMRGAVPYSAALSVHVAAAGQATTLTCFAGRNDAAEADRIIELIRQAHAADSEQTVAVLVRSRSHLAALVPALKAAGIPWQAQEIDSLASRPAIRDLVALTKALLHPADRVAWLSVLHAPWCGLCLNDLLALCGMDAEITIWECLTGASGQPVLFPAISADGLSRLEPVVQTLARALANKGRISLRRLIESVWLGLNGPAGLTAGDLADAGQFFILLDGLDEGGDLVRIEALEERLGKLFAAPDAAAGPHLQLMTIHKAKGLEFDTVILPGLGRTVRAPERPLLLWQEQFDPKRTDAGLLLAPLPASVSDDQDPTYQAIARIHAEKDRLETMRLFYVAATRARRRLHLLGHARRKQDGSLSPAPGSFLHAAWPVLSPAAENGCIETAETVDAIDRPAATALMLRRLPVGWSAPPFASSLSISTPVTRRASDAGHREVSGFGLSSYTQEDRIVGNAVHELLERIACDGLDKWSTERLADAKAALRDAMICNGVSRVRVDGCLEQTLAALENTLKSPRGRWILDSHRDAACELALTGVVDGMPVHAIIDRTFIDEDGVCWIIDYKTSAPGAGESLNGFVARESGRYRSQLDDYKKLVSLRNPECEVRTALYFPVLDAWCEVDRAGES
jgi:ATP-dependent exoDNAse (exonuclease V) beta subunit